MGWRGFGMKNPAADATPFNVLLDRLRNGDDDAARELIDEFGDAVRREIRFRLRDSRLRRVVADSDVFQSVVLRFLWGLRLGKFDVSSPHELLGLLRKIAERRVCREARFWGAQRRDVKRTGDVTDVPDTVLFAADPTPSRVISEQELIVEALARLPEQTRQMFQWLQGGLSWAEIAARLGETATAESARKQYERAVAKVAAELGLEDSG